VPCLTLGIGKPFLLPPPQTVPTGLSTATALQQFGCKSLMTVPHILGEMVALPHGEGVDALLPLQYVACGGGPLTMAVGEKLAAAGVKLLAHFGTTEIGPLAPIFVPSEDYDWRYWRLRDDYRITVEPAQQQPEQQNTTPSSATGSGQQHYQLTALPFGWDAPFVLQDGLITSDRNPGRDFRAVGRKDDLIVLVTGEKVSPQILESALCQSELVKAAAAFGDGQFELGVIVERADAADAADMDMDKFKAALWPIVAEAGRQMDSHARISSLASIVVTGPERPLPRSDKGSVLRKEAYRIFEADIQKAYRDVEHADNDGSSLDPEALEDGLKKLVQAQLQDAVPDGVWGPDDDLFELGVNSLQAARIARAIKRALKKEGTSSLVPADHVGADFVYRNPIISRMADALRLTSRRRREPSEQAMIDNYVSRYSGLLFRRRHVILLTGSSGTLGSYVLQRLVALPHVSEVICLVRKGARPSAEIDGETDYAAVQIRNANSRGANIPTEYASKVTVVQADPFHTRLGLQQDAYARLCEKVDHILHCAWPVDFQRAMSSFENQFRFLQNLVQLAADANELQLRKTRLLFVSSIAVVGQYHRGQGSRIVPEEIMEDAGSTNDFGYGKAKLVCERILANTAGELRDKVEVASVRLGQISGARASGIWNSKEHFPALVRLSQTMKAFPKLQGVRAFCIFLKGEEEHVTDLFTDTLLATGGYGRRSDI
jgi:nucleoside-diphosphate-sugar epimerase